MFFLIFVHINKINFENGSQKREKNWNWTEWPKVKDL